MAIANDTRGWILTCISAVACVLGASVICVDIFIRLIPGKKDFKIENSNAFLSSSLSLSAGVMLFSALYSMLPSSKTSLEDGGFSASLASWILLVCFLGGVFGIQLLSRVFHYCIPSHIVDCDHTHDEEEHSGRKGGEARQHSHSHHRNHNHGHRDQETKKTQTPDMSSESTPLLSRTSSADQVLGGMYSQATWTEQAQNNSSGPARPSFHSRVTATVTGLVSGRKSTCDKDGPCFGFSDPCGQECLKIIKNRQENRIPALGGMRLPSKSPKPPRKARDSTRSSHCSDEEVSGLPNGGSVRRVSDSELEVSAHTAASTQLGRLPQESGSSMNEAPSEGGPPVGPQSSDFQHVESRSHHHHVPTNAFLSISLQTSIAIALHKLPEGFITYATNHANPKLGFTIFLALFIHNISEGFALALPIYLASNSRIRSLAISFVLGGLSQPLGAGIAAVWLKVAEQGRGQFAPSDKIYGGMFAVTAGIMASVALSLLQESLELTHNKRSCLAFAFIGMGILGASTALNA